MGREVIMGVIILGILGVFLTPAQIFMPESINTMLVLGLVVGFLAFAGLVWREQASDERESVHIQKSGRLSFFAGAVVLVVGIVLQAMRHEVDPWLVYALAGMVVAKVISRIIHNLRN